MSAATDPAPSTRPPSPPSFPAHSRAFVIRRALNWFPLGLAYAFLYMGRYNLNVSKTFLGDLMTKDDFGAIFGTGAFFYAVLLFFVNGWLTDRLGGRKSMLIGVFGACASNAAIGLFLRSMLTSADPGHVNLRLWMQILYSANMYFQSMGAVAIVKANSTWFHVRERGSFSGIFGTMISAGIFFAYTGNFWIMDLLKVDPKSGLPQPSWMIFWIPAALLFVIGIVLFFLLRDRPSEAGHADFDTGDADEGASSTERIPIAALIRRIVTNKVLLTIAAIEFCTGVVRQGIMQWFPIFASEVWVLPRSHELVGGHFSWMLAIAWIGAVALFFLARSVTERTRAMVITAGLALVLLPFFPWGWGGVLFVAGVIGGNVAGRVSDAFFQSRRAPAAGGLYLGLAICSVAMVFAQGHTTNIVGWPAMPSDPALAAKAAGGLVAGDQILAVGAKRDLPDWLAVSDAVESIRANCVLPPRLGGGPAPDLKWDAAAHTCASAPKVDGSDLPLTTGVLPLLVLRDGKELALSIPDPRAKLTAGDKRKLSAGPKLTLTPWFLGIIGFFMSICVIGTHGLLSGTATMDFGGRRGAATAVALIDGCVYLGTALQGFALGALTTKSWSYWPLFLIPFCVAGFLLCLPIWKAAPRKGAAAH